MKMRRKLFLIELYCCIGKITQIDDQEVMQKVMADNLSPIY